MKPEFFYFDLGKVLIDFSVERMCRQMGDAAGIDPARVMEIVFAGGLEADYEAGKISSREFYERFCRQTGTSPDYDTLARAGSDIFTPNAGIMPLIAELSQSGYRLGILSNTCEGHWEYCMERYSILRECFAVYALSYRIGACKPDAAIFAKAAELAGCRPERIFYTDDLAGHVAGARAAGFDAVQYTSTPELAAELRKRGVDVGF